MSAPLEHRALRCKIAAHARVPPTPPDPTPAADRGFGRALRRAGGAFDGLGLRLGPVTVEASCTLDTASAALPPEGLILALEDADGRRGLIGLSSGMVDALVEVQTTGRVEAAELPPRPVTRIDEALARDFVELALAAFAREGQGVEGRDWPERMGYGSRIRDRGQINLLLPEAVYTVLSTELGFDGVARRARLVLVLPRGVPSSADAPHPGTRPVDPVWLAARKRLLDELRLSLEVVLLRLTRPLAEVQRLAVGDMVFFSDVDLQQVTLEDGEGRVLLQGRLGQIGGRRAMRLPGLAPQPEPERLSRGPEADAPLRPPSTGLAPLAPAARTAEG